LTPGKPPNETARLARERPRAAPAGPMQRKGTRMKQVNFALKDGGYFARVDGGPQFLVGRRVAFQGMKGLANVTGVASERYDNAQFRDGDGDVWADFIYPTSVAEGGFFHTLNTYDRAHFTFGFLQFAAHVPDGDFVRYFRALLELPAAADYFPDLALEGGRIVRERNDGPVPIEDATSTAGLLDYLNPSTAEVEDTEVIQAAKFIHWVKNDPDHRKLQVDIGKQIFRQAMAGYDKSYGLDGRGIDTCLVVADIRHQGRGSSGEIRIALGSANPVAALLQIGAITFPERVKTVRRELDRLMQRPAFADRKYSRARGDFA
jgi:hypothetical protein